MPIDGARRRPDLDRADAPEGRDLVSFGMSGIEVVLPVEQRGADFAESQPDPRSTRRAFVRHWSGPAGPGRPGTFEFGGPDALRHLQNIFVSGESSTWHSSLITVSYAFAMTRQAYRSRPSAGRGSLERP
jgi:hypothetical protein